MHHFPHSNLFWISTVFLLIRVFRQSKTFSKTIRGFDKSPDVTLSSYRHCMLHYYHAKFTIDIKHSSIYFPNTQKHSEVSFMWTPVLQLCIRKIASFCTSTAILTHTDAFASKLFSRTNIFGHPVYRSTLWTIWGLAQRSVLLKLYQL